MSLSSARMRDGKLYERNQQFVGNGKKRSCGKCGRFLTSGFKKVGAYGLCCAECRGVKG